MDWKYLVTLLFGTGVLGTIFQYVRRRIKANERKTDAVCLGVQALLRDRLYQAYNYHRERGHAPIPAKENFENMWTQYHNLGANGVMDGVHEAFMKLPTETEGDRPHE